jgi:hypothetical protein
MNLLPSNDVVSVHNSKRRYSDSQSLDEVEINEKKFNFGFVPFNQDLSREIINGIHVESSKTHEIEDISPENSCHPTELQVQIDGGTVDSLHDNSSLSFPVMNDLKGTEASKFKFLHRKPSYPLPESLLKPTNYAPYSRDETKGIDDDDSGAAKVGGRKVAEGEKREGKKGEGEEAREGEKTGRKRPEKNIR